METVANELDKAIRALNLAAIALESEGMPEEAEKTRRARAILLALIAED